jgi:hypothetical protein
VNDHNLLQKGTPSYNALSPILDAMYRIGRWFGVIWDV